MKSYKSRFIIIPVAQKVSKKKKKSVFRMNYWMLSLLFIYIKHYLIYIKHPLFLYSFMLQHA